MYTEALWLQDARHEVLDRMREELVPPAPMPPPALCCYMPLHAAICLVLLYTFCSCTPHAEVCATLIV